MFLKPYRSLLLDDPTKSHYAWLQKDIEQAPQTIVTSLTQHVENIESKLVEYHVAPSLKLVVSSEKPPDVSFKFSGKSDFIFRDLAFGIAIVKTLLDKQNFINFFETIKVFFDKLLIIDSFLNNQVNKDFERFYIPAHVRSYHQSFVIGLKPEASTIHDIEYVDIFLDDNHAIIPTKKPLNLCPEVVNRTGISIRFYLNPVEALFKLQNETVNCSSVGDDNYIYNTITDNSHIMRTTFVANSTEYYFETYYKDIDSVLIKYLESYKEKLTARLGYEPEVINKDILNIIDMVAI